MLRKIKIWYDFAIFDTSLQNSKIMVTDWKNLIGTLIWVLYYESLKKGFPVCKCIWYAVLILNETNVSYAKFVYGPLSLCIVYYNWSNVWKHQKKFPKQTFVITAIYHHQTWRWVLSFFFLWPTLCKLKNMALLSFVLVSCSVHDYSIY